ncbi:MAG: UDP-N-acetylmuramate dehydrogenase, partial [Mycobacteriaceae bacterium]
MLRNTALRRLRDAEVGVRHDVALSSLTTLHLGGPAATVLRCPSADAVVAAVRACDDAGEPMLLLGGGSNLVVADAGFDGTVVALVADEVTPHPDGVSAEAGADWDALVAATVARGLAGLECLSGIPGSTGATPVQNVGAYGVEIADVLAQVQLLDRATGQVRRCGPEALGLGYRTSALKHTDTAVVLSVRFALEQDGCGAPVRYAELAAALGVAPGQRAPAARVRTAVLALRAGKAMVLDAADHDTWSAGSFFTNPVVADVPSAYTGPVHPGPGGHKLSAGWLIEHAGFTRGYPGPAAPVRLSTRHTLALT